MAPPVSKTFGVVATLKRGIAVRVPFYVRCAEATESLTLLKSP